MTINPFLAGVLLTLGVELLIFAGIVLYEAIKYKNKLDGGKK